MIISENGPRKHKAPRKQIEKLTRKDKGMHNRVMQSLIPARCRAKQAWISLLGEKDNLMGELRRDKKHLKISSNPCYFRVKQNESLYVSMKISPGEA